MCEVAPGEWLSFSDSQPQGSQTVQEGGWGAQEGRATFVWQSLGPRELPLGVGRGDDSSFSHSEQER